MRIGLALVFLVGCGAAPMTASYRMDNTSRIESTCEQQACGGSGEALPATLIGLAIILSVTAVYQSLR
jgi:hypothetical protein